MRHPEPWRASVARASAGQTAEVGSTAARSRRLGWTNGRKIVMVDAGRYRTKQGW